jgi:hypothetical protein
MNAEQQIGDEHEPMVVASHDEFADFGQQHGYPEVTTRNAWKFLVRQFQYKTFPEQYQKLPWYESFSQKPFPVRFLDYPPLNDHGHWDDERFKQVDGLEIRGLQEYAAMIELAQQTFGDKQGREHITSHSEPTTQSLTRPVGPQMVRFWRDFAAEKLAGVDTTA